MTTPNGFRDMTPQPIPEPGPPMVIGAFSISIQLVNNGWIVTYHHLAPLVQQVVPNSESMLSVLERAMRRYGIDSNGMPIAPEREYTIKELPAREK